MNQHQQNPTLIFNETLEDIAEQTFGELAFMLTMPQDEGDPACQPVWGYGASVDFTGPFDGKLFVSITAEMMEPLAANMLGLEPGEEPPEGVKIEDALKELLNVICGNLLPVIADDKVIFNIASPEILADPNPPGTIPKNLCVGESLLPLDSGVACIKLFVDEAVDAPQLQQGCAKDD